MEHKKNYPVTDETRDAVIRLKESGWSSGDTANLLNLSVSTVSYTIQAHTAAKEDDTETLARLLAKQAKTVSWAVRKFNKPMPNSIASKSAPDKESEVDLTEIVAKQDELLKAVNDIGSELMAILEKLQ